MKEKNTQAMPLVSSHNQRRRLGLTIGVLALLGASLGCGRSPQSVEPRTLDIQQQWQLQPGTEVAGYLISGGLGDISVELAGAAVYAPFAGEVQPLNDTCFIYSSPDVPAYVFRLCGLNRVQVGEVIQGGVIGRGEQLQFAALRKQPEGQWAMVEPSRTMLEQMLAEP